MSKKVYSVRILVETEEDVEVVESRVCGWGEATFEGFVLLDLAHVKTSLVDIDSLAHTLSRMVKSQENLQEVLKRTTESLHEIVGAFTQTNENLQDVVGIIASWKKPAEATAEKV